MPYEPENDPRHVPWVERTEEPPIKHDPADIHHRITLADEVIALFSTPGWNTVRRSAEVEHQELDMALRRETDQAKWSFLRGQMLWIEAFLAYPDTVARQRGQWVRILEGLETNQSDEGAA